MNRATRMDRARKRVLLVLAGGLGLAGLQQQLLLQRPPRLLELRSTTASSGPAALDLRFSRPMRRASLALGSSLEPRLAWRWLGEDNPLRLLLLPQQTIPGPLQLLLAGGTAAACRSSASAGTGTPGPGCWRWCRWLGESSCRYSGAMAAGCP